MAKELYSAREAAEALGISLDTLRRWDREGKLTPRRLPSGQRLYEPSQITEYLEGVAS